MYRASRCGGSLVIAATPGAATIGAAAPVILVLARVFQGLSLGGEYGASATYMSEMAAWGRRIPFVVGAALAFVAYWLRKRLQESPSFVHSATSKAASQGIGRLFLQYPRQALTVLGFTAGGSLLFYVYTTYMQKFLTNTAGFSKDKATQISALSLIGFMLAQPVFGWLSDKIGRKPMMLAAFGGGRARHLAGNDGSGHCAVRRDGRVRCTLVQIGRIRKRILYLRILPGRDQLRGGADHAGDASTQLHRNAMNLA